MTFNNGERALSDREAHTARVALFEPATGLTHATRSGYVLPVGPQHRHV